MEFSKLGEDGVLIGAAVMVLEPLKRKGLWMLSSKHLYDELNINLF